MRSDDDPSQPLLDERDPFEIDDDNRTHLLKHGPFDADDLYDAEFYAG